MGNRYSRAIVFVCSISASNLFAQRVIPKLKRPTSEVETAVETPTPEAPDATVLVSTNSQALVPRLVKFSGTLENLAAKPVAGTVDVTFSLYADETGGSPLWFETQTVEADSLGRYAVLLGARNHHRRHGGRGPDGRRNGWRRDAEHAGGGAGASEDPSSIGGPGGGGASGEAVLSVTPGATLTIIVGAGGAGGTYNTTNSGSSGGTTEIEDQTNTVILSAGGGGGGSCGSCGAAVGAGGSTGIAPTGSILHTGPDGNECNNSGCPGYTPISFLNGDVRIGRAGFNNGTPSETETIGGVEGAVYIEW